MGKGTEHSPSRMDVTIEGCLRSAHAGSSVCHAPSSGGKRSQSGALWTFPPRCQQALLRVRAGPIAKASEKIGVVLCGRVLLDPIKPDRSRENGSAIERSKWDRLVDG